MLRAGSLAGMTCMKVCHRDSVQPATSGYLLELNRKQVACRLSLEILVLGLAMEAETYKAVYRPSLHLFIHSSTTVLRPILRMKQGAKKKGWVSALIGFGLVLVYKQTKQTGLCHEGVIRTGIAGFVLGSCC